MDSLTAGGITATCVDNGSEVMNRLNNEDLNNEEQIDVCGENTCNDDRLVGVDKEQLNTLIRQLTALCDKKLSKDSTTPKNQSPPPPASVEKNVTQYCHKCGSLQVTKRTGAHTSYVYFSESYNPLEIDEEFADKLFFSSLLPHLKNIQSLDKLEWQIQCLRLCKKYLNNLE